jgi:hypothetical protein
VRFDGPLAIQGLGTGFDGAVSVATVQGSNANKTLFFTAQQPVVLVNAVNVGIDIKPGGYPNSIKLGSNGVVPVAILSSASFNAPLEVDPASVTLSGAHVKLNGKAKPTGSSQDVNNDGRADLVVQVVTQALQLSSTDTLAVLRGKTKSGVPIIGTDSVRIIK